MIVRANGWVAAVVVVAACGRFGFSGRTDATEVSDVSDDGANVEACNGIDDDSDALVDEGCPCVPFEVTLDGRSVRGGDGAVWTGAEVVIVSADAGLDAIRVRDGVMLPAVDLGGAQFSPNSVAWTGTAVAVVWQDMTNLAVRTYTPETGALGPTTPIGPAQVAARIAWANDRLIVAWVSAGAVFIRELDRGGAPLGPARMVTTTTQTNLDAIIATSRSYVLGLSSPASGTYAIAFIDRQTGVPTMVAPDLGAGRSIRLREGPAGVAATLGSPDGAFKLQLFAPDGTPLDAGVPVPAGPGGPFMGDALLASSHGIHVVGFTPGAVHDVMTVSFDPTTLSWGPVTVLTNFSSGAIGSLPSSFGSEGRIGLAEFYSSVGPLKNLVKHVCL